MYTSPSVLAGNIKETNIFMSELNTVSINKDC